MTNNAHTSQSTQMAGRLWANCAPKALQKRSKSVDYRWINSHLARF